MRWNKLVLALAILVACCVTALCWVTSIFSAAPEQQLTVYTAQTSYSLPVMDRNGKPYIAVADLFSPLGASLSRVKSKEWKLELNKAGLSKFEARLTEDKDKAIIRGHQADLSGKVLAEEGRILVPMEAALPLLSRLLNTTVDFHQPARRIFVGNTITHIHTDFKNQDPPSLVLSFNQPVKPETSHDQDRTTLVFHKEPLTSEVSRQQFGDGAIQSLAYSEENGTAILTITGNAPLQITRSNDGKTLTLQAEKQADTDPTPGPSQQNKPSSPAESQRHTTEFFVMIDPSHGGPDKGASFGSRLTEKEITLRLGRELHKELEERGIASRLLRDGDIELGLERRAEITNEQHAGMYVALHAGRPGKGVRVYAPFLTDPQQPATGRFLPWESAQSGSLTRSQTAALTIAGELRKKGLTVSALGMPLRPLNNIVAPAIAVELAPEGNDMQSLESPKRQNAVASALAAGIAQAKSQFGARP
jgi:N-acetylmuramoyl-L-alanine amidase